MKKRSIPVSLYSAVLFFLFISTSPIDSSIHADRYLASSSSISSNSTKNPYQVTRNISRGFKTEDDYFNGRISGTLERMFASKLGPIRVLIIGAGGGRVVYDLRRKYYSFVERGKLLLYFINKEPLILSEVEFREAAQFDEEGYVKLDRGDRWYIPQESDLSNGIEGAVDFLKYFHDHVTLHDVDDGLPEFGGFPLDLILVTSQVFYYIKNKAELLYEIKKRLAKYGFAFISEIDRFSINGLSNKDFFEGLNVEGKQYIYLEKYIGDTAYGHLIIGNQFPEKPFPRLKLAKPTEVRNIYLGNDKNLPLPPQYSNVYDLVEIEGSSQRTSALIHSAL